MPESSLPSGATVSTVAPLSLWQRPLPATAQRRRTQKPSEVKRLTTGAWGPAPANAPDFGPVNPPDAVRTERIVKDVLRVGDWPIGTNPDGSERRWNVTRQTLETLASNFRQQIADGDPSNLGKTHGDPKTALIHPDDLMTEITDVKVFGDTLWFAAYVTPEEKKYLENPARKVSIGAVENYHNAKRFYPGDSLIHVAVTDKPVYIGQGPFLSLANEQGGGGSMNPELLDAINVLMEAAGLGKLGDVADEAALIEQLKGVAAALGKETSSSEEPPAPPSGEEMPMSDFPMPGVPAPMAKSIQNAITLATKAQADRIKTLETQLADEKTATAKKAETDFMAAADKLVKAGATVGDVNRAKLLAKSYGYDQRFLEGIPTPLNKGGAARTLATNLPPGDGPTDEARKKEVAKDIAKRRGISEEAALKLVP